MKIRSMITIKFILFSLLTFACIPEQKHVQEQQNQESDQMPVLDSFGDMVQNRSEAEFLDEKEEQPQTTYQSQVTSSNSNSTEYSPNLPNLKPETDQTPTFDSSITANPTNTKNQTPETSSPDQTKSTSSNSALDSLELKSSETETQFNEPEEEFQDHNLLNRLLEKYVSASGQVNYKGLQSEIKSLDAYLADLKANPVQESWSRNEKMAFWINAYNAFTIKLILNNFPLQSIMKLHEGKPWDVKWIEIGLKTYSLNEIEHEVLRPQFNDARIHFAVNCAAVSCPPLLNKAWTASNLESNFEKQAKAFINNPTHNKIKPSSIEVSKIFEWYGSDFGNLIEYLNKYSQTTINQDATINFIEYDWALNG